jgi:glycosyltransferase involved in cell wall biosynthesis
VLGYIGALDRVKGVHLLLAALPRLAELGFSLRLAGEGRLEEEVAAAAQAHVALHWEGHLTGEAKRRFLEDCDVGLIPSVWAEPGGPTFTMIEWLAARRPVLVSDRGGLGEVAGMYPGSEAVAPDVEAIVQAVAALRDTRRWRGLARAAGGRPPTGTATTWASAHEALYRTLLS